MNGKDVKDKFRFFMMTLFYGHQVVKVDKEELSKTKTSEKTINYVKSIPYSSFCKNLFRVLLNAFAIIKSSIKAFPTPLYKAIFLLACLLISTLKLLK
jgi:hypothetical protein